MEKTKKKIAIIGCKGLPAYGGLERATEEILKYLDSKYDFTIYEIDSHKEKDKPTSVKYNSILFKGNKSKRFNTFVYYIKSALHAIFVGKYDIVHLHHLYSGFICPILRIKYKVIGTVRGIVPVFDNKWNVFDSLLFKTFEIIFLNFSSIVVSVSKPQIEYLKKRTPKNIHYVPNGININEYQTLETINQSGYLLFSAARIISIKGCHTLLNALHHIKYEGKTVIIGDLDHVKKYKSEIKNLAVGLNVEFIKLIKSKKKLLSYIKNSRLFIFPSLIEGMSNMLLEAASMKTPIICSNIPSNQAIFSDKEVLYFEVGNHIDLADKINWANNNYNQMLIRAENAYKKLEKEFTWEIVSEKYARLYEKLLSE